MRSFALALPVLSAVVNAAHIHQHGAGLQQPIADIDKTDLASILGLDPTEVRLIELEPGITKEVTEEQKWELKKVGTNFIDITDHQESYAAVSTKKTYKYPSRPQNEAIIRPLLAKLDSKNMKANLEKFTSFYTRYYKSSSGAESSRWLLSRVNETASIDSKISVAPFVHRWGQNSIIAHIPPKSEDNAAVSYQSTSAKRVVIGAHQDSVNLLLPMFLRSPGADDDGSGTVTILEAFRVLVGAKIPFKNPVEFHWYSAEEGGLLGSQAIFNHYKSEGYLVGAMLQQDMTGFVRKTLDAGQPESVGVITDYVDPGLTAFIKKVISTYCDIPYVETKCGYACSDHASASKAGYQSAFVIESAFENSDDKIHSTEDKIEYLSFEHMLQHAKLTLALALELGLADLEEV
ncbi:Leucine aminopeptidase 1 [Orbilia oligospora]|uniref:Peptide hydrolase n=1 Tax=Orbilia oligospora TaxID=2813651 RepID=A0A7C8K2N5_ORBOL|nr:Leucine aminopeptidase 1 [Orbilia oligospora]KAF3183207.1 Leucine aminopeptidase 1 [Orbilia oligospora]KAF3235052.1 Leucine aminopeptidase 1 [Orbilia oligospora]KAF3251206.1 Leucine aminopeptidase 1 [Orbilia oligospora]KAF3285136.1 Leucine aminopeptidase 1 [Orbilia oligospora]